MKEIDINKIHKYDARDISKLIDNPIIDVTITSPPYFDMKDYGYTEQIGFGQNYENYLEDLRKVFEGVYACTKNTGSLWVIIDTFRRAGSVVPLPFDFANKIAPIGWKLQEIIIWGKDKTVPWAHNGQMRNLFEYILVFSKTDNYKFFIDKVRQYDSLKKWWVKYPERYNPKGKTPEAIWNFPIPVQGSWGENYIRHFCPLPEELIAQILKLTTEEEDLVLDPFAGSGAVLAKADNMKRKFIGTELNPLYIQMFQNYMDNTSTQKRHQYENEQCYQQGQDAFEKLILNLRVLKYAKAIYGKLPETINKQITKIKVEILSTTTTKSNAVAGATYTFEISQNCDWQQVENELNSIICKPPLSKFGIEPIFKHTYDIALSIKPKDRLYAYTKTSTHKYTRQISLKEIHSLARNEIIFSSIGVNLNEKDFE